MRALFLLVFTSLVLSGCSLFSSDDGDEDSKELRNTEKGFYETIQKSLKQQRWDIAIRNLQALEAQHPFGKYAEQAQLELIYAHVQSNDYEAAIAAADRFIRLHPQHPNVDYAYYMKGLTYFKQSRGFLSNFALTDTTARDPGKSRESFVAFSDLLNRFPNSPYAADASKRMIHLRNLLARYEIHVANYYFKRGAYIAAANRGRYVVENFQMTPAVPDALAIMAQAYHLLDMHDLSESAVAVLATNYPDYPYLDQNGNFRFREDVGGQNRSLMSKLTFGLYDIAAPPGFDTKAQYNPIYRDAND